MGTSIFDIFDEEVLYGKTEIAEDDTIYNCSIYSKTKEDFLREEYKNLSSSERREWDKDKKSPSLGGIISRALAKHTMEILNAIEADINISEKVLMQYESLKVIFFD